MPLILDNASIGQVNDSLSYTKTIGEGQEGRTKAGTLSKIALADGTFQSKISGNNKIVLDAGSMLRAANKYTVTLQGQSLTIDLSELGTPEDLKAANESARVIIKVKEDDNGGYLLGYKLEVGRVNQDDNTETIYRRGQIKPGANPTTSVQLADIEEQTAGWDSSRNKGVTTPADSYMANKRSKYEKKESPYEIAKPNVDTESQTNSQREEEADNDQAQPRNNGAATQAAKGTSSSSNQAPSPLDRITSQTPDQKEAAQRNSGNKSKGTADDPAIEQGDNTNAVQANADNDNQEFVDALQEELPISQNATEAQTNQKLTELTITQAMQKNKPQRGLSNRISSLLTIPRKIFAGNKPSIKQVEKDIQTVIDKVNEKEPDPEKLTYLKGPLQRAKNAIAENNVTKADNHLANAFNRYENSEAKGQIDLKSDLETLRKTVSKLAKAT